MFLRNFVNAKTFFRIKNANLRRDFWQSVIWPLAIWLFVAAFWLKFERPSILFSKLSS
jgi:hypothetical protein